MFGVFLAVLRSLAAAFQPRRQLLLENLALRHQLLVLSRNARKPKFSNSDRLLWICLRAVWSRWERALVILRPQTVIGWHRAGFRLFWRWKSRGGGSPTRVPKDDTAFLSTSRICPAGKHSPPRRPKIGPRRIGFDPSASFLLTACIQAATSGLTS
jgi:hypothetical protein